MPYASGLERRITRRVGQAIADFGLIDEGDRILVGVSGGKDSMALLRVLDLLRRRAPVVKWLLGDLEDRNPGVKETLLRAMANVSLDELPVPPARLAAAGPRGRVSRGTGSRLPVVRARAARED